MRAEYWRIYGILQIIYTNQVFDNLPKNKYKKKIKIYIICNDDYAWALNFIASLGLLYYSNSEHYLHYEDSNSQQKHSQPNKLIGLKTTLIKIGVCYQYPYK